MDYSDFLLMKQEISLLAVILLLLIYDIFSSDNGRKYFQPVACVLFLAHTIYGFISPVPVLELFGGMFVNSEMSVLMKNILNIGTFILLLQTNDWLRKDGTVVRRGEFFTVTLSTLLGMYFMVSAGNFLLLFIGVELASLPMAVLTAFNKRDNRSAEAGAKYIMLAGLSSAVMLFGISFLYGASGSLYFGDVAMAMQITPVVILGFVFFFSGLGFKISIVPYHLWTADVYQGAPTSVTAYLSVVSKGAAAFILIFVLFKVFGELKEIWIPMLRWLAIITITVGNLFAIRQKNLKRFFAFSSISQAGYVLLGIIAGTAAGMQAMVYFILVYIFSNLAIFGVLSAVENQTGKLSMRDYNGLYKTNPMLSFVMMVALFSLAGIPPFAGFFSKLFIFMAAAEQGEYMLVFIALLNTVISLFYYLLVVKAMFINKSDAPIERIKTDGYNRLSLTLCFVAILVIGFMSYIFDGIGTVSFGL